MASTINVTVASWNVLADAYVRPAWFPLTPPELLTAGARTAAVVQLAGELDVDVLALQEADTALAATLTRELDGYDVRWCPKTDAKPDGCLTAVRCPWQVVAESRIVFGSAIAGHVAHLLRLAHDGVGLTVANTHVRFDTAPAAEHLGVRQVSSLLDALPPVAVVAADLNDLPGGPVRDALIEAGSSRRISRICRCWVSPSRASAASRRVTRR